MKDRLFFVLLAASILSGCGATGRLYPVRGPLSAQAPARSWLPNSRAHSIQETFPLCSPMARYAKGAGQLCLALEFPLARLPPPPRLPRTCPLHGTPSTEPVFTFPMSWVLGFTLTRSFKETAAPS